MAHFYEKNIVDIKNEYTTFLINILTPSLYEGLSSMWKLAIKSEKRYQINPDTKNPGVLMLFQRILKDVKTWNNQLVENVTSEIRIESRCAEWFDDLVRAVIKSHIVLLTYNSHEESDIVKSKFHENVEIPNFIHKCYISCAVSLYNMPDLFRQDYLPLEIKKNQLKICKIINESIKMAIRKVLPMNLILKEYLNNDYQNVDFTNKMTHGEYVDVEKMLKADKWTNRSGEDSEDSSEEENNDRNEINIIATEDIRNKLTDLQGKINNYDSYKENENEKEQEKEARKNDNKSDNSINLNNNNKTSIFKKDVTPAEPVGIPSIKMDKEIQDYLSKENVIKDFSNQKSSKTRTQESKFVKDVMSKDYFKNYTK